MDTLNIEWVDGNFDRRWEALMSVDDLVEGVVAALTSLNILNDTYIIYSADNGFNIGQFRSDT
jgi:N-acetylglucosamine-6-sulfatase